MTQAEEAKAAEAFAEFWKDKGDEKQHSQQFWTSLLRDVLGVARPEKVLDFEKRVKIGSTKYIDGYIAETRTIIEQKGAKIDLDAAEVQSDGTELTPFAQAKRYDDNLPYDEKARWIVVSNFREIRIHDMKNQEPEKHFERVMLSDLSREYYRLAFLIDQKNENIRREEEISFAAGELVQKLYNALYKEFIPPENAAELATDANPRGLTPFQLRSLNVLCVRIVFCLYAEDAGLFATRTSFEDYIKGFNLPNARTGLMKLFQALDTPVGNRDQYEEGLKPFPYVNGGLFKDEQIEVPGFTEEIVDVIVNECAPFNWSEISPTIFGAVFESTLNPETRRKGGMHYTSIANIHKVIDPLFLDELNAEFDMICAVRGAKQKAEKLLAFQNKLGGLKFLDPACGSGNFLTETYICLRRLENKVVSILNKGERVFGFDDYIKVHISQFYGIEINDFAVTVAKAALWIAESQMVAETEAIISQSIPFLPLTDHANIIEGNALRLNWSTLSDEVQVGYLFAEKLNIYDEADFADGSLEVHSPENVLDDASSIYGKHFKELNVIQRTSEYKKPSPRAVAPVTYDYIMGNPPFSGAQIMDKDGQQKEDILTTFADVKCAGNLDYVCCWYKKASEFILGRHTKCAFVSTNSIVQGEQVAILWKPIFETGIQIDFAYRTFKWYSESFDMAHVHCVIVAFSDRISKQKQKFIFDEGGNRIAASHINAYLLDLLDVFVESRTKPLQEGVSLMNKGSQPTDGGNLIIKAEEYEDFVTKEPGAKKFIREFLGSDEFIKGKKRYCLWLVDASPAEMRRMPLVAKRIEAVRENRLASTKASTRNWAAYPYLFTENRQPESGTYLLVPSVSSEKRRYVPIGFMNADTVASNLALVIPNATLYHLGILTSNVHNSWMRAVCGRLKSDYRYSATIVYNNFPWPSPTDEQRSKIEQYAQAILDARAKYTDSSLADLYDETFMPADLRKAHRDNDKAVMAAYGFKPGIEEAEIVAELFKLYEKLVHNSAR